MNQLCSISERIIQSLPEESRSQDQEYLIDLFHLSYNQDDDNSDVENVLVCDDLDSSVNPLSSENETPAESFTLLSFLHFVSTALSSLSLPYTNHEISNVV